MLKKLCVAMGLSYCLMGVAQADFDEFDDNVGSELDFASMEDADALLTLIQLVESNISTKTNKLDKDYLPGLVSALTGEEMKARGVRTLKEALTLMPGMYVSSDRLGFPTPVIRGVGGASSSGSGKIKFMLNGVSINSTQSGLAEFLWDIPVEQISRIEVIRGPGSAVHGEYAYMGVINVVTYNKGNFGYVNGGSHGNKGFGGLVSAQTSDGAYISINSSSRKSDGDDVYAGEDGVYPILGDFAPLVSKAPGQIDNSREHFMAVLNAGYTGAGSQFNLRVEQLESQTGGYFGLNNYLQGDNQATYNTAFDAVEASYKVFGEHWSVDTNLGWKSSSTDFSDFNVIPAGFPAANPIDPEGPPTFYVNGLLANTSYKERGNFLGVDVNYSGIDSHNLLFGIDYAVTESYNSGATAEFAFGFAPDSQVRLQSELIPNELKREVSSFFVQDQYAVTNTLEVTIGAHFDHYSDSEDSFSPRLAAVYQLSDYHLIKAQYGEAFRPPTFTELYSTVTTNLGDATLEPETINTFELAYIYKGESKVARVTAFYSELNDLISLNVIDSANAVYQNGEGATAYGIEAEWEQQFTEQWKLLENISYVKTEDDLTSDELPGSYTWLANVGVLYQPTTKVSLSAEYKYVSSPQRLASDPRDEVDSSNVVDLTLSVFQLAQTGITWRLGAKNVFDEEVVHPAPPGTYKDDYPQEGRMVWSELMLQF